MLQIDLLGEEGIVILTPHGALESGDFERLSGVVDPYLAANGALKGLMVDAASFPGWDGIGALIAHVKFVMGHHRQVARVAVVSDSELLKLAPQVAKHFVAAEICQFPAGEREDAGMVEGSCTRSALGGATACACGGVRDLPGPANPPEPGFRPPPTL